MKALVIYMSKTGFTQKYAEMIAQQIGGDLTVLDKTTGKKLSGYDTIIYGGGLYAGMINGLKKAKELYQNSTAKQFLVFATGGTANEAADVIDEMWKNNFSAEELEAIPHFYMQGGICYEKMTFPDKTLLKMMSFMLNKKKEKSDYEEGFAQALMSSYDISSKEYVKPLVQYLNEQQKA